MSTSELDHGYGVRVTFDKYLACCACGWISEPEATALCASDAWDRHHIDAARSAGQEELPERQPPASGRSMNSPTALPSMSAMRSVR